MNDSVFPGYPARKVLFASFLFAIFFHIILFAAIRRLPSLTPPKVEPPVRLRVYLRQAPTVSATLDVRYSHPFHYAPPVPPKEHPKPRKIVKPKLKAVKNAPKKIIKKRISPIVKKNPEATARPKPVPRPAPAATHPATETQRQATPAVESFRKPTTFSQQRDQKTSPGSPVPPASRRVLAYPDYGKNPALTYPSLARERGLEGEVILKVLVSKKGRPLKVSLEKSSGHSILDRAAMKAVRGWVFKPGKLNGRTIEMWVRVPVVYRLR